MAPRLMGWFGKKKKKSGDEPTIGFVWSTNALLRVAAPSGGGWKTMEAKAAPPMLAAFKCVFGAPPDVVALDAVVSKVQPLPTLAQMMDRDWEAHYEAKMFASIEAIEVKQIVHATRTGFQDKGCEIAVEGQLREPAGMNILLRERFVASGAELLTVTVAAPRAQHSIHLKIIDSWLAHASLAG